MKKLYFLLFSFFVFQNLNAQWEGYDLDFNPVSTIWDLDAVDANTVWVLGMNGTYSGDSWDIVPAGNFATTSDGGATWTTGAIPLTDDTWGGYQISAVDENTAWVAAYSYFGGGTLFHTTDKGTTWQEAGIFDKSQSFTSSVHFWDADNGVVIGDPISGPFEIFTTEDGGKNWVQVDAADIPDPLPNEYVSSAVTSVYGDHIWWGTSVGRVYHSVDKGKTWTVGATPIGDQPDYTWVEGIAFMDEKTGIAHTAEYSLNPFEQVIVFTEDGGQTWTKLPNNSGSFSIYHSQYIPGTNVLVSTSRETNGAGVYRTSFSQDHGSTWTDIETGTPIMDFDFLDETTGWGGKFKNNDNPTQVFKYTGSPISSIFDQPKSDASVSVFPNPTGDIVFAKISMKTPEEISLRLTDMVGKVLEIRTIEKSEFSVNEIDLSKCPAGIYTLKIQTKEGIVTKKIIKK